MLLARVLPGSRRGDTLLSSAGITDANILFVVAQQWDVIAGVIPSQIP